MSKSLLKNIIISINGSQSSIHAAMYGIMLAKQYEAALKVVFVVDTATIKFLLNSKFFVPEERDSYTEALRKDGRTYLDYVKKLASSKGVELQTELLEGSVCTEVIKAADDFKSDMLIIGGKEGKGAQLPFPESRRNLVTTAREEIVNFAHCPVLVIHKPEIEALFKIS
ncbi:MAG: universal stress protein [Treponema sp.]|nr:universal stress protein [Treponema sp.]